jgi:hypothetical protein
MTSSIALSGSGVLDKCSDVNDIAQLRKQLIWLDHLQTQCLAAMAGPDANPGLPPRQRLLRGQQADDMTLRMIRFQQPGARPPGEHRGQLPRQIMRILDAGVGPETAGRWHDVRCIAKQEHPRTARLWELHTGRPQAMAEAHTGAVLGVAPSADGRRLVSGGFDGLVRVWETHTGACRHSLRSDRRYERLDVTGLTGVTDAQRAALRALGAFKR